MYLREVPGHLDAAGALVGELLERGRRQIEVAVLAAHALVADRHGDTLALVVERRLLAARRVAVAHAAERVPLRVVQSRDHLRVRVRLAASAETDLVEGRLAVERLARAA